jgi:hypothetical protein
VGVRRNRRGKSRCPAFLCGPAAGLFPRSSFA